MSNPIIALYCRNEWKPVKSSYESLKRHNDSIEDQDKRSKKANDENYLTNIKSTYEISLLEKIHTKDYSFNAVENFCSLIEMALPMIVDLLDLQALRFERNLPIIRFFLERKFEPTDKKYRLENIIEKITREEIYFLNGYDITYLKNILYDLMEAEIYENGIYKIYNDVDKIFITYFKDCPELQMNYRFNTKIKLNTYSISIFEYICKILKEKFYHIISSLDDDKVILFIYLNH